MCVLRQGATVDLAAGQAVLTEDFIPEAGEDSAGDGGNQQ